MKDDAQQQQVYLLYFLQGKGSLSQLLEDESQGKNKDFNIEMIKVHLDNNNEVAIDHFTQLLENVPNNNTIEAAQAIQCIKD